MRTLGANVLKTDYDYYGWTLDRQGQGQGRIKSIKTGTTAAGETTSLYNLA